jgi:cation transport ATPase
MLAIAMGGWVGIPVEAIIPKGVSKWVEFVLATPVVLWAGSLFFARGWKSIVNRSPNMFTLIMVCCPKGPRDLRWNARSSARRRQGPKRRRS